MPDLIAYSESTTRLEAKDGDVRLRVDFAIVGLGTTRMNILARRALSVLSAEESRLLSLSDAEADAELDSLMTRDEVARVVVPPGTGG